MTDAQTASALLALARERFEELSAAEVELFTKAPTGETVTCGWGDDDEIDPAQAAEWGTEKIIRSECLEWLCANREAQPYVHRQGPCIQGARIENNIDLRAADIPFSIGLFQCAIHAGLTLYDAHIKGIYINNSYIGPFESDRVHVHGSLFLNWTSIKGGARLLGATISGDLTCGGGCIENDEGFAFDADRAAINGSLFLNKEFHARGEVRFLGADIGGNLECSNGLFGNPKGTALNADGMTVKGDVFLDDDFQAVGETRFLGADIGGNLECGGGQFTCVGGYALDASTADIRGNVFLEKGFQATGKVSFMGANIGGKLRCDQGVFNNPGETALYADSITVGGYVGLRKGFQAQGKLDFSRATVHGTFQYHGLLDPNAAELSLECATLGVLMDEEASWPAPGNLRLHGLTYTDIHHTAPRDAATRKRWLALQPKGAHTPQSYEQLASALRRAGHERDAREILIEKNRRLREFDPNMGWLRSLWHKWFGRTLAYGYKPEKALGWIAGSIALGIVIFHAAYLGGLMVRAQTWNIRQGQDLTATMQGEPYPCFNAVAYAIDTFVPFIDLDQEDYWIPANYDETKLTPLVLIILKPLGQKYLTWTSLLHVFFWFYICLGWIFTGLLIIGITGMLQRRSE